MASEAIGIDGLGGSEPIGLTTGRRGGDPVFFAPLISWRTRYQTVRVPSAVGGLPSPFKIPLSPSAAASCGQDGALAENSWTSREWFSRSQRYNGERWPRPFTGLDRIRATICATSGAPVAEGCLRAIPQHSRVTYASVNAPHFRTAFVTPKCCASASLSVIRPCHLRVIRKQARFLTDHCMVVPCESRSESWRLEAPWTAN